jgi:arsenite methyltransferase
MNSPSNDQNEQDIRVVVRERYAQAAIQSSNQEVASCCGSGEKSSSCCGPDDTALQRVQQLYETPDVANLPLEVTNLSLGCGDPVTLASLQPGQVVLDLGSGGGIDCFLAARQVGKNGHVIGVDMTPQMIDKARANKAKMGAENVEFRLGEIEHLPVPDASVDVIISNCVINLSPDKQQVFNEAFRVLKSGGKLAVSDIVTDGPLPPEIKRNLSAWAGCVAGAWEAKDYLGAIEASGFVNIQLTPVYLDRDTIQEAAQQLGLTGQGNLDDETIARAVYSARVSARKP